MRYAIILAGGVGTRFWPSSRINKPKQFLNLLGSKSMLQMTVDRIQKDFSNDRIFVITNKGYMGLVQEQLPGVPAENIIGEVVGKNTAPAVVMIASILHKRDSNASMIILPADHHISKPDLFISIIKAGFEKAESGDNLITIGIHPHRPETGYGYIQINEKSFDEIGKHSVHKVKTFAEKPDLPTAITFLESGDFLWNSGMFIWTAATILGAFQQFLPEMFKEAQKLQSMDNSKLSGAIDQFYKTVVSVSIDYGIMEKADTVYVIPGSFGWSDVGSWMAVYELSGKDTNGNVSNGADITFVDAHNNFINTPNNRHIALVGVQGLAIVDTGDALLISRLDASQDVKKISDVLKDTKNELLR